MEDVEFDVLDELYFVISYSDLHGSLDLRENDLKDALMTLENKGWIRIYNTMEEEVSEFDLVNSFKSYYYLASKKGLLAHNRE